MAKQAKELSSAKEILKYFKQQCVDESILTEAIDEIFVEMKNELAKILKTKRFKKFLSACLFSELKEQLIETKLIELLPKSDRDYILTKAVKEVLKIK